MTQLLCTFSNKNTLQDTVANIQRLYDIVYNNIYVLQSVDNPDDLFCTYNINLGNVSSNTIPNTISLHRKKYNNTLYTINALNDIIKKDNNGKLDTSFEVDWAKYKNCIIITNSSGLKIIPTRILKIIKIS